MGMLYTLTNEAADTATVVLVRNLMDQTPTQPFPPDSADNAGDATAAPGTAPSFVYCPWQYLNPSPGATEAFFSGSMLSVIVRMLGPSGTPIQSRQTQVQIGASYALKVLPNSIVLQPQSQSGTEKVEIVTPPQNLNDLPVDIFWYWGGIDTANARPMGVTRNVGAGTIAHYELDSNALLFLPVPGDSDTDAIYSAAEAATATSYLPPNYANGVQVSLDPQPPAAGTVPLRYMFTPPPAMPSA